MKYTYILTGIKRELVWTGTESDCWRKNGGLYSSGQTIFSSTHLEGITLGIGEEVDEFSGGASGMGVDSVGEVGDRASEGQAAGVYAAGFTRTLASIGARNGTWGLGIKDGSGGLGG